LPKETATNWQRYNIPLADFGLSVGDTISGIGLFYFIVTPNAIYTDNIELTRGLPADLNNNGTVDFADFAIFTDQWLLSKSIPDPEITNPSFENGLTGWGTIVWGSESPEPGFSAIQTPSVPDGDYVSQINNTTSQISVLAQEMPSKMLVPGQWYEISCKQRCEDITGQGSFLAVEFWDDGLSYGAISSEHLVGTTEWTDTKLRFLAPAESFRVVISQWIFGGTGIAQFDSLSIREVAEPDFNNDQRKVIDGSFWGMFTWLPSFLNQYAADMSSAGVYWQRMGLASLEQQSFVSDHGMVFQSCIDSLPAANDPDDECYPVTDSDDTINLIDDIVDQAGSAIRVLEVVNEANIKANWTLEAYSNALTLIGSTLNDNNANIMLATSGFSSPYTGYVEAILKRDHNNFIDIVPVHPYAVDEPLDSQLFALREACEKAGRDGIALAINETGFPTWDPATGQPVDINFLSEKDQATKIVKLHIQALAHEISYVCYLGWNNFEEESDHARNMGLVRLDGSPKPAHQAYLFMTQAIGNRRIIEWTYNQNGSRVYKLGESGKTPVWVIWNALCETEVLLDVGTHNVFPHNIYGVKQTVTPKSGKFKLQVGNEPIYVIPTE
jgi:hypothetical protein